MPRVPARRVERTPIEIDHDSLDVTAPTAAPSGWLSFHYSSTVVTRSGGSTHVRSRSATLRDGKLTQESFEGELPGNAYADLVTQAQQQFARQAELMLKSFSFLLPFRRSRDGD